MKIGIWVPLAVVVLAVGCGEKKSSSGVGDAKKLQIAVIPKGTTHEFWKSVHAGAAQAGQELGVEVIWKGPLKEDDRDDQIKVVEDFTTRRVDGIVLAPLDDMALRGPVIDAQNAGIPVLIIDSGLKDVDTVSFVATDNFAAGRMAGEKMAEVFEAQDAKVALLRYLEGSASTTERENGFLEGIKKNPRVQVVSSDQFAGATTETAQKASENIIARFKNPSGDVQFHGVFCPNESSTFGMLRALQDAGLAGKIRFFGFDSSPKLVEALQAGEIDGLVVQDPFKMGYLGVKLMVAKIKGETLQKRVDTGAILVDKAGLGDPNIAKLVNPPK